MNHYLIKQSVIALVGVLLFIPFLGHVHLFDWDEANFAEAAREMLVSKNFMRVQIGFEPFWEKPPLFIWFQAISMSVFGINEFAARLPNAIFGILTLCTLFYAGKKVVNERVGWWWVLLYGGSWLPHFYFKTAIIDPVFNFFIFLAFFQFYLIRFSGRKTLHSFLSGAFLGLAVLTKGPVALLIAILAMIVYLIYNKGFWGYKWHNLLLVILSCAFISFSWFGIDIIQNGWWFTKEFITYQIRLLTTEDAGHGGPFYYHFLILLFGCFPAAAFLFYKEKKEEREINKRKNHFKVWMWILLMVTLVLFSLVKTKIVHYSSLCYFPLTFLAALRVSRIEERKSSLGKLTLILLVITGLIIAFALVILPLAGIYIDKIVPYIKDEFTKANLQAEVTWNYWLLLPGFCYLISLVFIFKSIKRKFEKSVLYLVGLNLITIPVVCLLFVSRIEAYAQRSAIEYYKGFAGQDVIVRTIGFKSYARLFYSEMQPYLENGSEREVFYITKVNKEKSILESGNYVKIGEKNGYVFLKEKKE